MKQSKILVSCLLLVGTYSYAQYNHDNLKIQYSPAYTDADNEEMEVAPEHFDVQFTYENLRLYPIIANDVFLEEHKDLGKFTLLKDAIEDDKIIITETGARDLANEDNSDESEVVVGDVPLTNTTNSNNTNTAGAVNANAAGRTAGSATGAVAQRVNDNQPDNNNVQVQDNVINLDQQIIQTLDGEYEDAYIGGGVEGTVNTLFAQNQSKDTIFIMAGEVVKGGKQDRVIAQDVVLAPGEEVDLGAFCVEASRWTTKDGNKGEFTGYYNVSSMDIREAVTENQDQSTVWSKVDEHTKKNDAESDTKAYTNLANSAEYQQKVKGYLNKFQGAFDNDKKVIGVIAVSGDEVFGMDMFATHELFVDSYENLIHSYIGHAITKGSKVKVDNDQVFAYLDNILKTEDGQKEKVEKNGTVYEYKDKKLHMTSYK